MKKGLKLFIAFVTALSLIFTATLSASAATVKISKTKATLSVGQTVTLKIKGASSSVKWSTNKKAVATVSSKGKVTAKKAGVAKITGSVNGRQYTCKVTVKEQIGSRQNPANARQGVTTASGKEAFNFKLNNSWRHSEAIQKLKEIGEWNETCESWYEDKKAGTDLLLMEFEAKALRGFDEFPLHGSDIFNGYSIYNEAATAKLEDFSTIYLNNSENNNDRTTFYIFDGSAGTFYYAAFVPDDLTVFLYNAYGKNAKLFWTKYEI